MYQQGLVRAFESRDCGSPVPLAVEVVARLEVVPLAVNVVTAVSVVPTVLSGRSPPPPPPPTVPRLPLPGCRDCGVHRPSRPSLEVGFVRLMMCLELGSCGLPFFSSSWLLSKQLLTAFPARLPPRRPQLRPSCRPASVPSSLFSPAGGVVGRGAMAVYLCVSLAVHWSPPQLRLAHPPR